VLFEEKARFFSVEIPFIKEYNIEKSLLKG